MSDRPWCGVSRPKTVHPKVGRTQKWRIPILKTGLIVDQQTALAPSLFQNLIFLQVHPFLVAFQSIQPTSSPVWQSSYPQFFPTFPSTIICFAILIRFFWFWRNFQQFVKLLLFETRAQPAFRKKLHYLNNEPQIIDIFWRYFNLIRISQSAPTISLNFKLIIWFEPSYPAHVIPIGGSPTVAHSLCIHGQITIWRRWLVRWRFFTPGQI